MFSGCISLKNFDFLKNWDISKVENMESLFDWCTNLKTVNLDSWKTPSLNNTSYMFRSCTNLQTIDMRNATFTQIKDSINYQYMFSGVLSSATIIVKADQESWIQNAAKFPGNIQTV